HLFTARCPLVHAACLCSLVWARGDGAYDRSLFSDGTVLRTQSVVGALATPGGIVLRRSHHPICARFLERPRRRVEGTRTGSDRELTRRRAASPVGHGVPASFRLKNCAVA